MIDSAKRFASNWLAVATTKFSGPESWKHWADVMIERLPEPPMWIIYMAVANSLDELFKALGERLEQEDYSAGYHIPIGNAKLGYHYLRYARGDYTLQEFLLIAGDEADGGSGDLDCEPVYDILNRVEIAKDDPKRIAALEAETKELFLPYKLIAERQWSELQSELVGS